MTQAANSNPDDFLLLFPPEVYEQPPTIEPKPGNPIPREVHGAPQSLTPARDNSVRPIDVAPRVRKSSGVRQVGINVSPIGFIFGAAVGAFGMWMFSVPPPLEVVTAVAHTVPAATVSVPQTLTNGGSDGSMSVEIPSVTTSGPNAIVPTVPAQIAVSDALDRGESTAAAPRRASNVRREAAADETPSMPFKGSLVLYSGPPGARAFVDGRPVGSTPVILADLPVGSRVVRLEAEGYQTWSAAIRVIANQQTRVTATLYREPSSADP